MTPRPTSAPPPQLYEGFLAFVMLMGVLVVPFALYLRGAEPGGLMFANLAAFGLCLLALARNSAWGWFGWIVPLLAVVAIRRQLDLALVLTLTPLIASWAYTARAWSRPWARRVGVAHLVLYGVAMHPFLVSSGPRAYEDALVNRLHLDPLSPVVQTLGTVVPPVWMVAVAVAVLLPGFLLVDLGVWALRAERDRRRG